MTDLLFCNGAVFDGTRFLPGGTRVRVSGERITAVDADLPAHGAEVIDLDGKTLLPGFVDAHVHPVHAGHQIRHCDLRVATDIDGYLRTIRAYAEAHPNETWITGGGWLSDVVEPVSATARELLDSALPDRPVLLVNADGHSAWANSVALTRAGLDRNPTSPPDGVVQVDSAGAATGILHEGAVELVAGEIPAVSEDEWYAGLLAAQDYLLAVGVTSWQDAIVGPYAGIADPTAAYRRAASTGSLVANVVGALWWERDRGLEQIAELVDRRSSTATERFAPTSVKMMLDGVIENHTAALLDPYVEHDGCQGDNTGIDFVDRAELIEAVPALDALGFQVHFHALGDRAVRHALDALSAARGRRTRSEGATPQPRHHLAHVQIVHPDDIPRFAELDATANIQPLWAMHEPAMDDLTLPFIGSDRAHWQYPFHSLKQAGARLCGGSDWPVSSPDPLEGIHVAVNRTPPGRPDADVLSAHQRLDRTAILAAYTSGSAWICGLDDRVGRVQTGLDADLVVVDADLRTIADRELGRAKVCQTWVRGELRSGAS